MQKHDDRAYATYRDPIGILILKLPYISRERKAEWWKTWRTSQPPIYRRIRAAYQRHDRVVIRGFRILLLVTPIVLLRQGWSVSLTAALVLTGELIVGSLEERRQELRDEIVKERTKDEYREERRRREETNPLL